MPDNSVVILDANGVPVPVDTFTVGTDHRQVVILGGTAGGEVNPVNGAMPVTAASPTNATRAAVAAATSDRQILGPNGNRLGFTVWNNSNGVLYLAFGGAGSTTDATVAIGANQYYEGPFNFRGTVRGMWAAPTGGTLTGAAVATEMSA